MFVYQPRFSMLELKENKGNYYVISWKSREAYNSKLAPIYIAFLDSIKLSGFNTEIQFNKSVLVVEQNSYTVKIVNTCIAYNLDDWPKNLLINFTFKRFWCGVINIVRK